MTGLSEESREVYEHVQAWLIHSLSEAGIDREGAVRVVSGKSEEPETYTNSGQPVRPYSEETSLHVIAAEEGRLLSRAREEGFFWDGAQVATVLHSAENSGGGSEHDVYRLGSQHNYLIIRSTVDDRYGFPFRSPSQYLGRLRDYNFLFPELQTRMIGVSLNDRGNGVIWTVQPFVEGREFKSIRLLIAAMKAAGWKRLPGVNHRYQHLDSGIILDDVHPGNVLLHLGKPYPIDVIVENLASLQLY